MATEKEQSRLMARWIARSAAIPSTSSRLLPRASVSPYELLIAHFCCNLLSLLAVWYGMVWHGCSSDAALSQLQFFFRILYGKMFFSLDFSCRRGSLFFERAWSGIFRRYLLKSSQRTGGAELWSCALCAGPWRTLSLAKESRRSLANMARQLQLMRQLRVPAAADIIRPMHTHKCMCLAGKIYTGEKINNHWGENYFGYGYNW